jgi:hypothetical protein
MKHSLFLLCLLLGGCAMFDVMIIFALFVAAIATYYFAFLVGYNTAKHEPIANPYAVYCPSCKATEVKNAAR